ncbi:MAG: PilZ domain-containing protein [Syntrophobacteraceae bacterium]|jgi:Tfp pilus assembly protein PilZ|nr:PilZ domain-containing protein [Syntrophobacteraceae bacterium]
MTEKENQAQTREKSGEKPAPCQVTFASEGQGGKGTSMHFSERGVLIECQQPLPLNSKVKVVLQFPGFKNTIELQGEVVWTNIYGPNDALSPRGMGVKFLTVERDTERLLADMAGKYDATASMYSCYYT